MALPEPRSLHACVAVPLNLLDLARRYVHLEGAIESNSDFPVFLQNGVMPWRQSNPKSALIVRREGCNREIPFGHDEGSIGQRS